MFGLPSNVEPTFSQIFNKKKISKPEYLFCLMLDWHFGIFPPGNKYDFMPWKKMNAIFQKYVKLHFVAYSNYHIIRSI